MKTYHYIVSGCTIDDDCICSLVIYFVINAEGFNNIRNLWYNGPLQVKLEVRFRCKTLFININPFLASEVSQNVLEVIYNDQVNIN